MKAAAIDLVVETAAARGVDVVLADNEVVAAGLDDALLELADWRSGPKPATIS